MLKLTANDRETRRMYAEGLTLERDQVNQMIGDHMDSLFAGQQLSSEATAVV